MEGVNTRQQIFVFFLNLKLVLKNPTVGEFAYSLQIKRVGRRTKIHVRYILILLTMPQFVSTSSKRTPLWGQRVENLPKISFLFAFSPTKLLAASTIFTASVLSLWTWNTIRWFSLESIVVERKYVFTRFNYDHSLTAFVHGEQFR